MKVYIVESDPDQWVGGSIHGIFSTREDADNYIASRPPATHPADYTIITERTVTPAGCSTPVDED
jgi:hypothetical protein